MKNLKVYAIMLVVVFSISGTWATGFGKSFHNHRPGEAKFVPPGDKKLLIIGQDNDAVGGQVNYNNGYVDHVGQVPGGVTFYTSLPLAWGLDGYADWGAGPNHGDAFNTATFKNTAMAIGLWFAGMDGQVVNGEMDRHIYRLAMWIKDQQRPIYLRIGYEFDNPANFYTPELFVGAFKRMVDIFRELKVNNVDFVWHSEGVHSVETMQEYYPGDDYVDWVGYSLFHCRHDIGGMNCVDPSVLLERGVSPLEFAEIHDKPVMIAELSPDTYRVDNFHQDRSQYTDEEWEVFYTEQSNALWTDWYRRVFDFFYSQDRIKAISYINYDWDAHWFWTNNGMFWGNSKVQDNPIIKEKWINEINNGIWLNASDDLFRTLGYPANKFEQFYKSRIVISEPASNGSNGDLFLGETFTLGDTVTVKGKIDGPMFHKLRLVVNGEVVANQRCRGRDFEFSWVPSELGDHFVKVEAHVFGKVLEVDAVPVLIVSQNQVAFDTGVPHPVPGLINATAFDHGGNEMAYFDVDAVNHGTYSDWGNGTSPFRTDESVDTHYAIFPDVGMVGWTNQKEWIEYTIDVAEDGEYKLEFPYDAPWGSVVAVSVDGVLLEPWSVVTKTGDDWGWWWGLHTINGLQLQAGVHVFRISFISGNINVSDMTFSLVQPNELPDVSLLYPEAGEVLREGRRMFVKARGVGEIAEYQLFINDVFIESNNRGIFKFTPDYAGPMNVAVKVVDELGAVVGTENRVVHVKPKMKHRRHFWMY